MGEDSGEYYTCSIKDGAVDGGCPDHGYILESIGQTCLDGAKEQHGAIFLPLQHRKALFDHRVYSKEKDPGHHESNGSKKKGGTWARNGEKLISLLYYRKDNAP